MPQCILRRYGEYVCDMTDQDVCSMECVEKLENKVSEQQKSDGTK